MKILRWILPLLLISYSTLAPAGETPLTQFTKDWAQVSRIAHSDQLLVLLLVSSEECNYCKQLKQEVLLPMQLHGQLQDRAMVQEMDLHSGGKIVDFDGEKVRAGIFLGRYKVFATPTLLFLDPAGRPLHEPLVGYNGAEQYRPLLEKALRESQTALKRHAAKGRIARN